MKKSDTNIEREIDRTLSMLEKVRRVNAPQFFYTRLQVRLRDRAAEPEPELFYYRAKHSLAIAGFVLLILLNAYSLWRSTTRAGDNVRAQQIASFAEEYGLTANKY